MLCNRRKIDFNIAEIAARRAPHRHILCKAVAVTELYVKNRIQWLQLLLQMSSLATHAFTLWLTTALLIQSRAGRGLVTRMA